MTSPSKEATTSLTQLISYLDARRDTLLNQWRKTCEADPTLKILASLPPDEFTNNVPRMLDLLQQQLQGHDQEDQMGLLAAEHGLHRWQKGYTLAELSAEMRHLSKCLLAELRLFWQAHSISDCALQPIVYEHFATFSNQINIASIRQYADIQRTSASSRVEILEKTLVELNEVSKQRSELLRHSSHDLRGSFGAIQGAATLLELVMDSQEERQQTLAMLLRNLTTCRSLVTQLMDLARLEAGQEVLTIQGLDAGQLLTNLVASYQPLARERGLSLKAEGPASLPVECDPVHLQRIVQNLVLNALKHTSSGFVSVTWTQESQDRWMVSVQDSGPGLPMVTNAGSLGQEVSAASTTAVSTGAFRATNTHLDVHQDAATAQASRSAFSYQGEGIGLSIVKRLCELLRAQLEIESEPGEGTLFRIRLSIPWHP
ncbi:sensor histidine kinase [Spirosoma soli]|uniref:histidine kinase n=1 Tax=Spirosoma soli TaxID=1770529 RepID=A0ABW5MAX8_9BACT